MIEIRRNYLTKNRCYIRSKKMVPKGIVVHSTGANNPNLKRYVQPDDGYLGKNMNGNDWNNSRVKKCVHAFIGKDKNGVVKTYQTLPWDFVSWGCGKGQLGSYNKSHIQFEICEDHLKDSAHFHDSFNEAIDLCAFLCKKFDIHPWEIKSHREAHKEGYASHHGDPEHWMEIHGMTMNDFRSRVTELL